MADAYLLENGVDRILLEDGSGVVLIEGAAIGPTYYRDQLAQLTPEERAQQKAEWFAALSPSVFTDGTLEVTIESLSFDGITLGVTVTATDNGTPLSIDGDLKYGNPPILVPDGQGGHEENLNAALREIVIRSVRAQL